MKKMEYALSEDESTCTSGEDNEVEVNHIHIYINVCTNVYNTCTSHTLISNIRKAMRKLRKRSRKRRKTRRRLRSLVKEKEVEAKFQLPAR